ncbi:sensor histidine kinase [Fulvivirga sp. RKSG066]|uniref:tetratricopeptide repeat-containing sensor histidine kinase n=1 Tax=Fulvivirga aurantia TaxID=2529383 RepID=UPI0012BC5DE6|nr:tetratricopeptide repeat-containing sensor histidine kinase [Fulvivirga aurantia]MTI21172.1 sensor histidine kinase [Fulvivirga aurantia]
MKKQGEFKEIINTSQMMLKNEEAIAQADPKYLLALADAFVELGNLIEARKYLKPVVSSSFYKDEAIFYANTNVILGDYQARLGRYDSAQSALLKAIEVYEEEGDNVSMAKARLKLGNLYLVKGDIKKAKGLMDEALSIYQSSGYNFGIAEAKRNLGSFYSTIGDYTKASQLLFEAVAIFEKQKNRNELAKSYNELSWVYQAQGSYDIAKNYVMRAMDLSKEINNRYIESEAYNYYGVLLDLEDSLGVALEAHEEALSLRQEIGDKKGIAASMYNMAYIMEQLNENQEARRLYIDSYKIEQEIGNVLGVAISEYTLGGFYTKLGFYDSAEYFLNVSRESLSELNSKENLVYNYLYSAELYEKLDRFKEATTYYRRYINLKDSLINESVTSRLTELEVKYDLKNKEKEIEYLNLENQAKQQELSLKEKVIGKQQLVISFIIICILLLAILLFVGYRLLLIRNRSNKQLKSLNREIQEKNEEITAQAEELQEANQQISLMNEELEGTVGKRSRELKQAYSELDTFFYRSSHDFRGPLTTFLGLAEVARSTLDEKYALDLFDKVETTALQLDKMVNKLKAMSLISSEILEINTVNFEQLIDETISNSHDYIRDESVSVTTDVQVQESFQSYPDLIAIIFENLLENALQYNDKDNAQINIKVHAFGKGVQITIKDNGEGIPEAVQQKVFNMYFRANEHSIGNGLGLYLVAKAVEKLNGKIKLSSEMGKGTSVNVYLPQFY